MRARFFPMVVAACVALPITAAAQSTIAWDITGGREWQNRTGPGIMAGIGGNDCTDHYCDDHRWDTSFFGSIGGTLGFFYRIIPNAAVFVDGDLGYMNTSLDNMDDDKGMLFELVAGGEFHVPATGWLDPYMGFGMGFAYLGGWATTKIHGNQYIHSLDYYESLKGFDFEIKIGVDVYPFSSVPNLALGPMFRLGMPLWLDVCIDIEDGYDECKSPDDMEDELQAYRVGDFDKGDLPFLVHFGLYMKYII
ncbi:MAG: outer membrane beta-barrel protein [Deltaproteobacteria bacterium]|nr:outer membrane beta-barrel protein [Deltaproteobacteria bacterium]